MKKKGKNKAANNEGNALNAVQNVKELKPSEPEEEKSNPYGGLPQRDLKKNLGCG